MEINFDEMTDRRNTSSLKWDVNDGELPMWVADMDFKTAPEIINAISEKSRTGAYSVTALFPMNGRIQL